MRAELTTRTNAEGTLLVTLGQTQANKIVRVTVEAVEGAMNGLPSSQSQEEWLRFIERTAGSITDPTFVRRPHHDPH